MVPKVFEPLKFYCIFVLQGFRPEDKDKDTDQIVLKMARDLNADMKLEDINRSRRVGKAHNGRARAVLLKFSTCRAHRNLFSKRVDIRNSQNWSGLFLIEDFPVPMTTGSMREILQTQNTR